MLRIAFRVLFVTYAANSVWGDTSQEVPLGPVFASEPPGVVQYASRIGARLICSATGDPSLAPPVVTWLADDGTVLTDLSGIRHVHSNGTLELFPNAGAAGIHGTVRCRASNAHGTLISRDVHLIPVGEGPWEVSVEGAAVLAGGVAALACRVTGAPARVKLWYRDDTVIALPSPSPDSRYLSAGDTLLIRDVSPADAGPYSCSARHELTALTRRSPPALLQVLSNSMTTGTAPRAVPARDLSVPLGAPFLPSVRRGCAISTTSLHILQQTGRFEGDTGKLDDPKPPQVEMGKWVKWWYRESDGRLKPADEGEDTWRWAGGAALCVRRAAYVHDGAWLCKAYNVFGDASAQTRVDLQHDLVVEVRPRAIAAEAGATIRLNCTASRPGARLQWLHDGAPLGAGGAQLVLRGAARAHRGIYQCLARDGLRSAQAAAEIRLGESPPELQYTFIEQAVRAGAAVTLRCAAAGAPPPTIRWLLDEQPLERHLAARQYALREERGAAGEVASILKMAAVRAADGGRYSCRASNSLGVVAHSARLNVYGAPSIRALGAVRAVAGENFTLLCPYAGYPISSVRWTGGVLVGSGVGGGGRVWTRNEVLRLGPALPSDAGRYVCTVTATSHTPAVRDFEIQVTNPPKISPFMFSPELMEGSSAQVLCGVSSGDKPIFFSWLKDGKPLPSDLQIEEKSLNEFSLLMFSELRAAHSGHYTCRVSNHAATVNYTALLTVNVAPSWTTEPLDTAVLLGAPLHIECSARGHPTPRVNWYRKIEGASDVEGSERWERASEGAGRATLEAPVASRSHRALYRCAADNGVGSSLVKDVNVTVHEPANFGTSSDASRNVSTVRGDSASLSCLARGDPPLSVHWTHRDTRLDLDSYRWRISEVRTADGVRSTLQLRSADRGDAGEYKCHARNRFGRSELLLYLRVIEPPPTPTTLRLGALGATWARVRWRGQLASDTHYSAVASPLHSSAALHFNLTVDQAADKAAALEEVGSLSARIDNLRPATAYSLRLTASNGVGRSPQSESLLFTTLEEVPDAIPKNLRVRATEGGDLHVSWAAPGREGWNGELLGYAVYWREADGARSGKIVWRGSGSTELTLSGLRARTRHSLYVRAFNRAGPGPPSRTLEALTIAHAISEAPTSVRCEAMSVRALRVRWAPPPGEADLAHHILGYDIFYAPVDLALANGGAARKVSVSATTGNEATVSGLVAGTNYSISVRGRTATAAGPPSIEIYCSTREDVPGAPEYVRAVGASAQSVRVSWCAPRAELRGGRLSHYTLYTRELGKVGGEWSQRVPAGADEVQAWSDVGGLREGALYEFWVRAATAHGAGAPSRAVTAAPRHIPSARITSIGTVAVVALGARVRLACAALGGPPLHRRWTPLPPHHTLTDTGDLIVHKMGEQWSRNYTCSVRNTAGGDAVQHAVRCVRPPPAPSPRLARSTTHRLALAWDPPPIGGSHAPVLRYTVHWRGEQGERGEISTGAGEGEVRAEVGDLACGASYVLWVQAHTTLGVTPPSTELHLRTRGDKATAPPAKECIWSNSSSLRVSLLAWGSRCPVLSWRASYRLARAARWTDLASDGEVLHMTELEPATWYEIRLLARSSAGETSALYRAATRTNTGEEIGEPIDLPLEDAVDAAESAEGVAEGGTGRPFAVAALCGGALLSLLVVGFAAALACAHRRRRSPPLRCTPTHLPHNGKTADHSDADHMHEISPYATFSMSSGACEPTTGARSESGARSCALHLRSFVRSPVGLAAPPPRPHLLAQPNEYGSCSLRESDSESSGSPCAACAAELYRLPAAHLSDTLPAAESSTEDGSYGSRRVRGNRRPTPKPNIRYTPPPGPAGRAAGH
ncbi:unnamed protein product [Leptosia nina]|uniref:Down syndrome cell adhesion molecule-like protein Dscam2 n=1 Tax=Leptosia nina TaxID=320188 RepID=A0AAV1ITC3_9NEOP